MQVQSINNTEFTGKENGYKKSYISRVTGTLGGAGLAYLVLKNEKPVSFKTKKGIIAGFDKAFSKKSGFGSVDEAIKSLDLPRKQFNVERTGIVKKLIKASKGVAAGLLVLGGLIVGGIADKIINKHRANKAQNV